MSVVPSPRPCQSSVMTIAGSASPGAVLTYLATPMICSSDSPSTATSASWSWWSISVRYVRCWSLSRGIGEKNRRYRDSGLNRSKLARRASRSCAVIGRRTTGVPSRSSTARHAGMFYRRERRKK